MAKSGNRISGSSISKQTHRLGSPVRVLVSLELVGIDNFVSILYWLRLVVGGCLVQVQVPGKGKPG